MARASVLRAVRKPQRKPSLTGSNGCESRRKPRVRCARCLLDARPQSRVTGELEQDKKPSTPSRLTPVGLGGRVAFASVAGAVLARGTEHAVLPAVIVASVAALVSARVGHDPGWRPMSDSVRLRRRLLKMRWRSVSRPPPLGREEDTQMKRSGLATHRRCY
jgi:hypothetical protein